MPFFTDGSASSPPTVSVFVHYDWRYGSFFGDSDHWCRSTACSIPAEWFFDALGRLQPGVEIVAQGRAEIVKEDEAWGIDCLDPHNNVTREEVQIMLRLELSADMRSVTLTLLQQGTGGWLPWAQLRQRDGAAPTVVL